MLLRVKTSNYTFNDATTVGGIIDKIIKEVVEKIANFIKENWEDRLTFRMNPVIFRKSSLNSKEIEIAGYFEAAVTILWKVPKVVRDYVKKYPSNERLSIWEDFLRYIGNEVSLKLKEASSLPELNVHLMCISRGISRCYIKTSSKKV